jgi:hypothetical protein
MNDKPLSKARLARITSAACQVDHVLFMSRCISMAQRADSEVTLQEALQEGLKRTATWAAMECLHYVLQQSADVHQLHPHYLVSSEFTSRSMRKVLEILVAHGYDINSESPSLPVLWYVPVGDHDFVKWCLNQGANVDLPGQTSGANGRPREPILERAAVTISILFSSYGAKAHLLTASPESSLQRSWRPMNLRARRIYARSCTYWT